MRSDFFKCAASDDSASSAHYYTNKTLLRSIMMRKNSIVKPGTKRLVNRFLGYVLLIPAMLLVVSCADSLDEQKLDPAISAGPDAAKQELVFVACLEHETKTAVQSNGAVYWCTGDEISVNGVIFSALNGGAATADFVMKDAGEAAPSAPYTAYYPASVYVMDASGAGAGAGAGAAAAAQQAGVPTLPAEQAYDGTQLGANLPMRAVAESGTTLAFRSLCGVIKITASSAKALNSIRLEADQPLSGPFTVNADGCAVVTAATGLNSVSLLCGGADISTAKDFYIPVPAGTYTNFKIVFTASDGNTTTKSLKGSLTVARNAVYTVTFSSPIAMDKAPAAVYYAKDGTTSETPVSFDVTSTTDYVNLPFSQFDWAGGDELEMSIDLQVSDCSGMFLIGADAAEKQYYNTDFNIRIEYASQYFFRLYTTRGDGWSQQLQTNNSSARAKTVIVKLSHNRLTASYVDMNDQLVPCTMADTTQMNGVLAGIENLSTFYVASRRYSGATMKGHVNYIKWTKGGNSTAGGQSGDEPGQDQPGLDEPGDYTDVDDEGIDASDVIYFTRTGHKKFNPAGFAVDFKKNGTATDGYNFKISGINWSAGDELEIAVRSTHPTGGKILSIGEDLTALSNIWGSNHIYLNPQANGYWWNLCNSRNVNIFGVNQFTPYNPYPDSVQGTIKICAASGVPVLQYKSNDLDTWHIATAGDVAAYLADIMTLDDLYIGSNPAEDSSGYIVYVKWTKAGHFTDAGADESYAGGIIDITNPGTSW